MLRATPDDHVPPHLFWARGDVCEHPEELAEQLVDRGAVLFTRHPSRAGAIGHLAWLANTGLFWFEAAGSSHESGHFLRFDTARRIGDAAIRFLRHDETVAYLATFESLSHVDTRSLVAAHRTWRIMAPLRTHIVCAACTRHRPASGCLECRWSHGPCLASVTARHSHVRPDHKPEPVCA